MTPANLAEWEPLARQRLTDSAYHYIAGGSAYEKTLARNESDFDEIRLKPRVLRDVSRLDTRTRLLGWDLPAPILLAPTSYQKLAHPEGEAETARAAGRIGTPFAVSTFSTTSPEDVIAAATSPLIWQMYVQPDREFTRELVQRVERAGYAALMLTVDLPCPGTRDRDVRTAFALPAGLAPVALQGLGQRIKGAEFKRDQGIFTPILDPSLGWDVLGWLRSITRLPVLVKGILAPEDAALAVEHGADVVIVSNHGARNLDTVPSGIAALPYVVEAVAGRVPVLMDGGIRRGTDVLKALALGAAAVQIGRPYLWGLAVAGADGVVQVYEKLHTELKAAMALSGIPHVTRIDRAALWP